MMELKRDRDHWSVTVERNGEHIVTIGSNFLCDREISEADEKAIRRAARHLLAFIAAAVSLKNLHEGAIT